MGWPALQPNALVNSGMWFARIFNKPHHEIENDPRVWDHAAMLIDFEIVSRNLAARESASRSCCSRMPDGSRQF
jgi:hypothetical protein